MHDVTSISPCEKEYIEWGVLMALLNWNSLIRVGVKLEREEKEKGLSIRCGG